MDENQHQKVSRYDAFGRLISVSEYEGVFAGPDFDATPYASTTYTYDELDNLTQVTDAAGNETGLGYDMLGRKVSMDDPDIGEWRYTYDAVDNLETQTDAKDQTITFHYDELNRRTDLDWSGAGALVGDGTWWYQRNGLGQLECVRRAATPGTPEQDCDFDWSGRTLSCSDPDNGCAGPEGRGRPGR